MNHTENIVTTYFQRLLNQKDLSVCDELLALNYIDHDAPAGTPPGPESTKKWIDDFLKTYPDLTIQIDDIIAESHKAALRLTWTGTHCDTKEPYHKEGIVIIHLNEEGQFVERWTATL